MCPCTASLNTGLHHPSAEMGEDPPEGLAAPSVVHRPAASAQTSLRAPMSTPSHCQSLVKSGRHGAAVPAGALGGFGEPVEGTRVERSVSPTDDGLRKGRITTQCSPDIPGLAYDMMPSLTHSFIHSFLMALPSHHLPCLPSLLLTQSRCWGIKKRNICHLQHLLARLSSQTQRPRYHLLLPTQASKEGGGKRMGTAPGALLRCPPRGGPAGATHPTAPPPPHPPSLGSCRAVRSRHAPR